MGIKLKSLNEVIETLHLKEQIEKDFYGTLDEAGAGLSRVLKKLESNVDFLIITASRAENSRKVNSQNNNKLIQDVRAKLDKKIGAYRLIGHWKECSIALKDKEKISDCKGDIVNALEETWLIVKPDDISTDSFESIAKDLSRKYNQDAYIIRKDGKLTLNGKDGSEWENLGKADKNSISTGFSRILDTQGYSELAKLRSHGRSENIIFEDIFLCIPKDNNSSKMLFNKANILY